jgi:hypothetical protein
MRTKSDIYVAISLHIWYILKFYFDNVLPKVETRVP